MVPVRAKGGGQIRHQGSSNLRYCNGLPSLGQEAAHRRLGVEGDPVRRNHVHEGKIGHDGIHVDEHAMAADLLPNRDTECGQLSTAPPQPKVRAVRFPTNAQFVQGRLIGDYGEWKNGARMVIKHIESIDLKEKVLKTYDGQTFKLIGSGQRMLLLNEDDIVEIALREMGDIEED